ncbi:uncharacterized [Tachysurus ichikawai]
MSVTVWRVRVYLVYQEDEEYEEDKEYGEWECMKSRRVWIVRVYKVYGEYGEYKEDEEYEYECMDSMSV